MKGGCATEPPNSSPRGGGLNVKRWPHLVADWQVRYLAPQRQIAHSGAAGSATAHLAYGPVFGCNLPTARFCSQ